MFQESRRSVHETQRSRIDNHPILLYWDLGTLRIAGDNTASWCHRNKNVLLLAGQPITNIYPRDQLIILHTTARKIKSSKLGSWFRAVIMTFFIIAEQPAV